MSCYKRYISALLLGIIVLISFLSVAGFIDGEFELYSAKHNIMFEMFNQHIETIWIRSFFISSVHIRNANQHQKTEHLNKSPRHLSSCYGNLYTKYSAFQYYLLILIYNLILFVIIMNIVAWRSKTDGKKRMLALKSC